MSTKSELVAQLTRLREAIEEVRNRCDDALGLTVTARSEVTREYPHSKIDRNR